MIRFLIFCVGIGLSMPVVSHAGVGSKVVQEAMEYTARKFGKEVAEEGVERVSSRMAGLAAKHGDELVSAAFRKAGPQAGRLALAVGATLTTFVTSPEEFLNGTAQLTGIVADAAVRPIAEIPKVGLAETLGSVTGLIGFMSLTVIGLGVWLLWNPDRRRWAFRTARGGFLLMRVSSFFRPAATTGA